MVADNSMLQINYISIIKKKNDVLIFIWTCLTNKSHLYEYLEDESHFKSELK